jgi:hypothetical protein
MLKWWVVPMLDYVNKTFGPPKNFIYAIASQSYFGGGITAGESVDKILADCKTEITAQIDETGKTNEAGRKQWVKLANDRGLDGGYCSYEGGPDHGGGDTTNIANRIMAERNAKMADVWTYNYDSAFFQVGGNLAMHFTLSSAYTRYGCWGLTDDITNPLRNGKYTAAKKLVEKYPAAVKPTCQSNRMLPSINLLATAIQRGIQITYVLHNPADITVTLWNIKGQEIARSFFPSQAMGNHSVLFAKRASAPGSEFLIVTVDAGSATQRCTCVLLK